MLPSLAVVLWEFNRERRWEGWGGLCTCVPLLQYALLNHQKLDGGNGESHDDSCENNSNQHSGIFFNALSVSTQNVAAIVYFYKLLACSFCSALVFMIQSVSRTVVYSHASVFLM